VLLEVSELEEAELELDELEELPVPVSPEPCTSLIWVGGAAV